MNLNLLRIFDAVATTGSVNLAAELLDMTAPAVSQALSKLREQYQDPLFIRQGRGIIATNFAIELHAEIQPPLKLLLNSTQSRKVFSASSSQRTFRISSHTDIDQMLVPFIHAYKDKHAPNVNIIISADYQEISARQDDLRLRKVDLILATRPIQDRGYHNFLLSEQPLVVVCSRHHPRIKESLSESQFFAERHLSWLKQSNSILDSNESAASKLNKRDIAYHSGSVFSALIMAGQTDWLCVAGLWHAQQLEDFGQVKTFKLPFNTNPIPIYMSWHQQSDSGQEWLKNAIIEAFKVNK